MSSASSVSFFVAGTRDNGSASRFFFGGDFDWGEGITVKDQQQSNLPIIALPVGRGVSCRSVLMSGSQTRFLSMSMT